MCVRYYVVNILNQIILSMKEFVIVDNFLWIYFEFFLLLLKMGLLGDMGGLDSEKKVDYNWKKDKKWKGFSIIVIGNEQEMV